MYFDLSSSTDLSRSNQLVAANMQIKLHNAKYSDSMYAIDT